jgi:DNA-binding NarL/FixJ family response regulator
MLHRMHAWEGGCLRKGGNDGRGTQVSQALVVEDLRLFREVLAVMLEEQTDLKKTIQTKSLAEARRVWERLCGDIDLAIVDLDLTNGDGLSLIENLREAAPDVPVLALTSARSLEQRARALRAGANEVITMDSSSDQIIDAAKRLLSR